MSIKNPKISVIIPVYNTENYLEECLDSILNQTFKEFEVICIEDKSTDNSANILKDYAEKDERVKIIFNEENIGQAESRNKGIEEACGEYISFIDSDDKIDLEAYEKLYNFSKESNQDLILFDTVRYGDKGEIWPSTLHIKSIQGEKIEKTNILEHEEFIYDTGPWNKLIKTSFLKNSNIRFINKLYEDLLFSMELFISTNSVGVYPEVKYYWRKRRNKLNKSVTQDRTNIKNIKDRIFIINEIWDLFDSSEKYKCLLNPYYCKLLDIDFRVYINQIDKGDEEYRHLILNEIKPMLKEIPEEAFECLNSQEKLRYELLIKEDIENLIYIIEQEKENKKLEKRNEKLDKKNEKLEKENEKLEKENKKLKREIKDIKSTKGWFKYKKDNVYKRLVK